MSRETGSIIAPKGITRETRRGTILTMTSKPVLGLDGKLVRVVYQTSPTGELPPLFVFKSNPKK